MLKKSLLSCLHRIKTSFQLFVLKPIPGTLIFLQDYNWEDKVVDRIEMIGFSFTNFLSPFSSTLLSLFFCFPKKHFTL
uniref:Uncharacterized protein n=1 Tax=Rhizophora mucronata TaxID=61149 RepID=A0A2P2Q9Q6_RHIMU